jgi:hypothetical protein
MIYGWPNLGRAFAVDHSMMARKKVVPEVERRTHRRIVTLRNFGIVAVIVVLIVAALNIRSELRDTTGDADFGRLYGREMKKAPPVTPAPIAERPITAVDESASADPFSLEAATREQYLGAPSLTPEPVINPVAPTAIAPRIDAESKVRIVGGPEGVALVQEERQRPQLGGGFGKP